MDRSKGLTSRVALPSLGRRTRSGLSANRLRRQAKFDGWRARRLDRLTDRIERRRAEFVVRRDRLISTGPREGRTLPFRRRWHLFVEHVNQLQELVRIRWLRFVFHLSAGLERLPLPTSAVGALAVAGASVTLAVAAIAVPPLLRDTQTPREVVPEVPDRAAMDPPLEETPPTTGEAPESAWRSSDQAGYRFSYPAAWDLSSSGTETILSDPKNQIVFAFATAASGPLEEASDRALDSLIGSYLSAQVVATEVDRTSQGLRSITVGGRALDANGAPIGFLHITIAGEVENRAISVRFPTESGDHLDAVLAIINSFEVELAEPV